MVPSVLNDGPCVTFKAKSRILIASLSRSFCTSICITKHFSVRARIRIRIRVFTTCFWDHGTVVERAYWVPFCVNVLFTQRPNENVYPSFSRFSTINHQTMSVALSSWRRQTQIHAIFRIPKSYSNGLSAQFCLEF